MPLPRTILGESPATVRTGKLLNVEMDRFVMNSKGTPVGQSLEYFLTNWAHNTSASIDVSY